MSKTTTIGWVRIHYEYKREFDRTFSRDYQLLINIDPNPESVLSQFDTWIKKFWRGKGEAVVTSILAGASIEAEEWGKKISREIVGKRFSFDS